MLSYNAYLIQIKYVAHFWENLRQILNGTFIEVHFVKSGITDFVNNVTPSPTADTHILKRDRFMRQILYGFRGHRQLYSFTTQSVLFLKLQMICLQV
jgi:hypothetical protein